MQEVALESPNIAPVSCEIPCFLAAVHVFLDTSLKDAIEACAECGAMLDGSNVEDSYAGVVVGVQHDMAAHFVCSI